MQHPIGWGGGGEGRGGKGRGGEGRGGGATSQTPDLPPRERARQGYNRGLLLLLLLPGMQMRCTYPANKQDKK